MLMGTTEFGTTEFDNNDDGEGHGDGVTNESDGK